jgi:L-fuconolactonase
MLKIDAHQHFWQYNPVRDSWITEDMQVIGRDFYPEDLLPVLQKHSVDGCVAVQADQSEKETEFLLDLASVNSFIKGVVGWIDLKADDLEDRLHHFKKYEKLKGFRHILQSEPDEQYMLDPQFKKGIAALGAHGYTYDILIFPNHLPYAAQLAAEFPDQKFVLDHMAKPYIKAGKIDGWKQDIEKLASYQNVYCKVSALLTEADWHNTPAADFIPYIDIVFNAFGINRVMFGSDWPVCLLAGGYEKTMEVMNLYAERLSGTEQQLFFGGNAIAFYGL